MSEKQDNLFTDLNSEIKSSIAFLEENGYAVLKLKQGKKNFTNLDVVEYFYRKLKDSSGNNTALAARLSDEKDCKAVSVFHEKAKKVGLGRKAANETLIDLINMVFDYYKDSQRPCPVYNLSYIISQRGSWVVQKAVQHARRKGEEWEASAEAEAIRRKIYGDLESEQFKSFQDQAHEKILQEESIDGKKENNN